MPAVPVAVAITLGAWLLRTLVPSLGHPLDAAAALAAAGSCALAARRARNRRAVTAWTSQGLACLSWAFTPLLLALGHPAAADLPRAAFLGFAMCGFWLTSRSPDRRSRTRMLLDGTVGAASVFIVVWAVVFQPIAEDGRDVTVGHVAFPLVPIVLAIFYGLLMLTEFRPGRRRMPALFAAGMIVLSLGDLRLAQLVALAGGPVTALDNGAWLAGFGLVGAAAASYGGTTTRRRDPSTAAWIGYAPYFLLGPAIVTVTAQYLRHGQVPAAELAGGGVIVLVVLTRQLILLDQNRALVSRLAAQEQQLRHQARHDPLTGLGNRALLLERLDVVLRARPERPGPLALLFCDLDDFKTVNDTLGHHAGDELLVQVAARLRSALADAGTVARLGGDEFAVLLQLGGAGARRAAEDALGAFAEPFVVAGRPLRQSVSVGLVDLDALPDGGDAGELLKAADIAMYQAKHAGKNGIRVFGGGPVAPPEPVPVAPPDRTAGLGDLPPDTVVIAAGLLERDDDRARAAVRALAALAAAYGLTVVLEHPSFSSPETLGTTPERSGRA